MNRLLHGFSLLLLLAVSFPAGAQRLDPAKWTLTVDPSSAGPGSRVIAKLDVTLEDDWHLYSPTTPPGGPIPTTIELAANEAVEAVLLFQQPPVTKLDPAFQINTETYGHQTTFLFEIRLSPNAPVGETELTAKVRYQLCNDTQCLPPKRKTASAGFRVDRSAPVTAATIPAGFVPVGSGAPVAARPAGGGASATETGTSSAPAAPGSEDEDVFQFLLLAFGFGLAAIFTPCVFPMIPIMMSHFLQRQEGSRRDSVIQALVFCLGIIVLFSALGLAVTALLGPFGIVQLGSNPWVNGFIALVFLIFGLSLLGAFEITLPSGLLTKMNAASNRGGYLGTLLMGLTFSLAAFACVGPFVGTLLAASLQDGGVRPLLGMVSFATGLALPFFFLALFPSYLRRMPRAGGWMSRVKIVLGFVILAAMFKYLSNIDVVLQLGLLTRERFLAIWIVLFALPGLYLLGFPRMEGVDADAKAGTARVLTGAAFLIFALSLLPGMFGGRLGELDAYVPFPGNGFSAGGAAAPAGPVWMKNQYAEALAQARAENKLVFVAFTGYACTNCHWMKVNMFPRPEVAAALGRYVLLELYTDGTDEASEKNQQLQSEKFSTVAIPYYAILSPDGEVLASFPGLTRDESEFLKFLNAPVG